MANETGPYADGAYGAYGQGDPQAQAQAPTQAQWNPYAQQPGASANGWPQQQAPTPNGWPQPPQQPANPWVQQQAPQGYIPQQSPQYAAPQGYPQQQGGYAPPPQQQAPEGLTPNPFALPGQNAYQGYNSASQGQPANPYAATPLGVNTQAKRDDQNFFQRTGLSKGKTVWLGVLLVAAAGFWTYDKFFSDDPSTTKVGDCVHTDTSAYDVKKVACTDPGATAKVLAKFDGTSDKSKCDPYVVEGGSIFRQIGKDSFVLCLGPLDGSAATDGSTNAG